MANSSRSLSVVPLAKESILFPSLVLRLSVDRKDTAHLLSKIAASSSASRLVACVPHKADAVFSGDMATVDVGEIESNLNKYACMGRILRLERSGSGFMAVIEGVSRITIDKVTETSPYITANVTYCTQKPLATTDEASHIRLTQLKTSAAELISLLKGLKLPSVLIRRLESFISQADASSAGQLSDLMVSVVEGSYPEKLAVLAATDLTKRLELVHELVSKQLNTIKVTRKISNTVDQTLNKQQKEYILRQKLNAIKKELNQKDEEEDEEDDATELRKKIDAAQMSPEAKQVAERELKRLKRMQPQQAEYQVIRTYLDNLLELPWVATSASQNLDKTNIEAARRQLDLDHYGLQKVKKRLVEYLAILRLKQTLERERISAKL